MTDVAGSKPVRHLDGPGGQMPLVSTGYFEHNTPPDEALALFTHGFVTLPLPTCPAHLEFLCEPDKDGAA